MPTATASHQPTVTSRPSTYPASTSVQVNANELFCALRLNIPASPELERELFTTRRVAEGETVFRAGDEFHCLYVTRSGFFKSVLFDETGTEKVLRFAIKNDLLGADGLASGRYPSEVIALEASEVIIVPFARLAALTRTCAGLENGLYSLLSRELVADQGLLYVMAALNAEGRVAAFLLNLAERYGALGYARNAFVLRMTRQEIGSYLGLKLETVSRAFSAFDSAGLIKVNLKHIDIVDAVGLRRAMHEPVLRASRQAASTERRATRSFDRLNPLGGGTQPATA